MRNLFQRFVKPYRKTASEKPLYFFNTYSGKKELFEPIQKSIVRMYNCGPTVYNYLHIGNFCSFVFANFLKRVLDRRKPPSAVAAFPAATDSVSQDRTRFQSV